MRDVDLPGVAVVLQRTREKSGSRSTDVLALTSPSVQTEKRMPSSLASGLPLSLGTATFLGLAAGAFVYASRWPGSQIFGRTLVAPARPGEMALTFDDGPNPACTPRLLDILARHGVKATLFLVGRFAEKEPALARAVADAGHLIGNHSWTHPNLSLTAAHRIREELMRTRDTLEQITGKPIRYFRPPFGARRPCVLRIARELGMTTVMWNAMTSDWEERSPDRIAERLIIKIDARHRSGVAANIVLHDGGHLALNTDRGPSMAAAEKLLVRYAPTHKFVTADAWA
jgi:peptidoglycan/xylan/chitin deacetylase (PgdA/CDA1 family)